MEPVKPRELVTAARVADGLIVVVGVAGVVAGAQLFRRGDVPFAIVAWILTFIAGAALRLVVWMARGIAQVMERGERIEDDLARLIRSGGTADTGERLGEVDDPDPYRRWGGWH
ncbi:hypothetical protein [Euzebya sp.]|uniref:hypothetical protein n=1 Tax=Euzebya sp. TaxID=1971409 RepID=UPI00351729E6